MYKKFLPDYYYRELAQITPEQLTALGVRGLVMDIDNTIVTYDDPEPTPAAQAWFDAVRAADISVSFVANNEWERVRLFNRSLGFPAYAKSGKPFIRYIRRAMEDMGTDAAHTALIGDQVFTDVWAGKRAGLTVFLVDPIKDKVSPFFRFKRTLERPVLRAYRKKQKGEPTK